MSRDMYPSMWFITWPITWPIIWPNKGLIDWSLHDWLTNWSHDDWLTLLLVIVPPRDRSTWPHIGHMLNHSINHVIVPCANSKPTWTPHVNLNDNWAALLAVKPSRGCYVITNYLKMSSYWCKPIRIKYITPRDHTWSWCHDHMYNLWWRTWLWRHDVCLQ